jgi:hypothetical protein
VGMRPDLVPQLAILLEFVSGRKVEGNPARFVKFGLAHLQESLAQIHILPIQTDNLAQTHSRNGQKTEESRVGSGSQAFRRRDLLGGFD